MLESLEQWTKQLWDLLAQVPGSDVVNELKERWHRHNRTAIPKVVVFGAVDAGKSSLLKRLLVERGLPVPACLGVSGQRQTFQRDDINFGEVVLVDTPGISGGNDEHEEVALMELQLADAYLWVMPPQLMTGDRELVISFLKGAFFAEKLPSAFVTDAVVAAIGRMDEAGSDPSYDLDGYQQRCEAKRMELAEALMKNGVTTALRTARTVSADPYQMVADLPEPQASDYADAREWDGVEQLDQEICSFSNDQEKLRTLAGVRFVALAAQTVCDVVGEELRNRERALRTTQNERRRLVLFEERLQSLIDEAQSGLEAVLEERLVLAERRVFQGTKSEMEQIGRSLIDGIESWATQYAGKLTGMAEEIEAEMKARLESPTMRHFQDLVEEGSEARDAEMAGKTRRVVGIMQKVSPAVRKGFREFAECELGMSLKQAAARLHQADAAAMGFRSAEHARKAANFVRADQFLGVTETLFDELGGLWKEVEDDRAETERLGKLQRLRNKLEQRADEIRDEQITRLRTLVDEGIRGVLETKKQDLENSGKVLSAQIEQFSRIRTSLDERMKELGEFQQVEAS